MKTHYDDIRNRIAEQPKWWDEHGVPRYCDFRPNYVANIYADEVALVLIQCQSCQCPFKVAMSSSNYLETPLHIQIEQHALAWGDPPNDQCCPAGPTMSSDMVRVLEFWTRRTAGRDWQRITTYERDLTS